MSPPSAAQAGNDVPTTNTELTSNTFALMESVRPLEMEVVLSIKYHDLEWTHVRRGCPVT